jgi:rRNA maturation protein Rpf1
MIKVTKEDFLFHFGIPGMKWGKRRAKTLQNVSKDSERVSKLKTKKLHELTNDELKDLTQRMQLERSFKDLKKSQSNAGKKIVSEILLNVAKQQAGIFLASFVAKGVGHLLKK